MSLRHPEAFSSSLTRQRNRHVKSKDSSKRAVVVDGSNIAYLSKNGTPSFSNIEGIYKLLITKEYSPKIVISSRLKYIIDDPAKLTRWIREGAIIEAESGTDDDLEILLLAQRLNAPIISNDRFIEHQEEFPWIPKRLWKVEIINSKFIIKMEKI